MNFFFLISISFILFYFLNDYLKSRNFLVNYKGQKHQKFLGSRDIPLTGGIFLVFSIIVLFSYYNFFLSFFVFLIFCVGFASDINFLSSPKLRLLIQSLIIICFVLFLDVKINETNFLLLDKLLENIYFSYFFSVFCLLILVNGSNFIDGLNGLLLSYMTFIILILLKLDLLYGLKINQNFIVYFIAFMSIMILLNLSNFLMLGDAGAYVLSFLVGYLIIKCHYLNPYVSPYFFITLIWYPCFENLFSIIRKFSFKKSPINADNNHLHQLLFYYLKKKKIISKFNINNASSFLIILYNLFVFILSLNHLSNSQFQIIIVLVNVIIYLVAYFKLFTFKYKINSSY